MHSMSCPTFLALCTVRLSRHCRVNEIYFSHSSSHVMCSVLSDVNRVPEMFLVWEGGILGPFEAAE
jgi:hypothetical protein